MNKGSEPGSQPHNAARAANYVDVEPDLLAHECELVRTAYAILLRRRQRYEEFHPRMFGEPAWDMLLELYVRETSGSSSTAEHLQLASGTAPSTAGRWLQYLAEEGLIARRNRPLNGGGILVELTDHGREALDQYLTSILNFEH